MLLVEDTNVGSNLELFVQKQIDLKPMDLEEAILQMDLLGHDFFLSMWMLKIRQQCDLSS